MLERGEQVMQVRPPGLRPGLGPDVQDEAAFSGRMSATSATVVGADASAEAAIGGGEASNAGWPVMGVCSLVIVWQQTRQTTWSKKLGLP